MRVALSGTPWRTASRRMISAELTDSGSIAAPEKMIKGAQPSFHSATAVSVRAPVSPEIATIASDFTSASSVASQLPRERKDATAVAVERRTPVIRPVRKRFMGRGYRSSGGVDRPREALAQRGLRRPEAVVRGLVRIQARALRLDGTRRFVDDAGRRAEQLGERRDELIHAGGDARADVEHAMPGPGERAHHRVRDVAYVDVVTLGGARSVQGDRSPSAPAPQKDRDHPTLEILALPRSVDVRAAQRDRWHVGVGDDALRLQLEATVV